MPNKPYAESCDQNREPIRHVLGKYAGSRRTVLEIGSGTGQHAVYFASQFPWLNWQTSDVSENHDGINAWIDDSTLNNVMRPLHLDVAGAWPATAYDLVFSANTLHIMSMAEVELCFRNLPAVMHETSCFLVYGPFNYQGKYTSDSNARFDQWLKQRDSNSGIKNFDWLRDIAAQSGLECADDIEMPANNRILVWQKAA